MFKGCKRLLYNVLIHKLSHRVFQERLADPQSKAGKKEDSTKPELTTVVEVRIGEAPVGQDDQQQGQPQQTGPHVYGVPVRLALAQRKFQGKNPA